VDLPVAMAIQNGFRRRYLFRKSKYRQGGDRFKLDLDGFGEDEDDHESGDHMEEEASQLPWLTEDEFLQKYRMPRASFLKILSMIENHKVSHGIYRMLYYYWLQYRLS
jgi:hypothetical protein